MRGPVLVLTCLVARAAAADPVVVIDAGHADVALTEDTAWQLREPDDVPGIRPWTVRMRQPPGELCQAPCNALVHTGRRYVIEGPAITRSEPFELPASGLLHIAVSPGSERVHDTGRVLEIVGGLAVGFGTLLFFTATAEGRSVEEEQVTAAVALGGIPLIVTGALLVAHAKTTVTIYDHHGTRVALDARRGALTF